MSSEARPPLSLPALLTLFVGHLALVGLLCLHDTPTPLAIAINLALWAIFCVLAAPIQALGAGLARRRRARGLEVVAMLAPGPAFIGVLWALAVLDPTEDPPNQRARSPSPNGRYVLEMELEQVAFGASYWTPHIEEDGREVYVDRDHVLLGQFNAYWGWDENNRLWLYHSDAGEIFWWERGPGGWERHSLEEEAGLGLAPPDYVLPDYARDAR